MIVRGRLGSLSSVQLTCFCLGRSDTELVDFDHKRDIEIERDCFVGMPTRESRGVKVKLRVRK